MDFNGQLDGTSGRTRTDTLLKATDFESVVSTNFTTLAYGALLYGKVLVRSSFFIKNYQTALGIIQ